MSDQDDTTVDTAPSTFNQASRKSKRAWRKNIDLRNVESGLQESRNESLITGGKPFSELDAAQLFQSDVVGSSNIHNIYRKKYKPLRADEILAQRSAIPALDTHRKSNRVSNGILEPSSKRRKGHGVSHQELERLKQVAYGGDATHGQLAVDEDTASHDPWMQLQRNSVGALSLRPEVHNFIPEVPTIRAPRTLRRQPISLAANGKAVPSVPRPHAGRSYNPSFGSWSSLLEREGKKAVESEKRRLEVAHEEAARLQRAAEIADEVDRQEQEMGYGSEFESEWEGIQSETESMPIDWNKKRPERKTRAERNRIKRGKAVEALIKHQSSLKRARLEEAAQLSELASAQLQREMVASMPTSTANNYSEDESDGSVQLRRRPIHPSQPLLFSGTGTSIHHPGRRTALPASALEVVLPDELQSSLRQLKPEGNLLSDRFRSAVVQGKVEGRMRPIAQPRKARTKVTEKWAYKDWKLHPTGVRV